MPWQAAPSLLIIFGAFNVAAGLIWTVDRTYYGKVRCMRVCMFVLDGMGKRCIPNYCTDFALVG